MPKIDRAILPELLVRILLPLFVLGFIHLSPVPRSLNQSLQVLSKRNSASAETLSSAIRQVLVYQPWRTSFWEELGGVEAQAENYPAAVSAYRTAQAMSALSVDGEFALGLAYENQHESASALQVYLHLAKQSARSDAFLKAYAIQSSTSDWAGAESTLRAWLAATPWDAQANYALGKLLAVARPAECGSYLILAGQINSNLANPAAMILHVAQKPDSPTQPGERLVNTGRVLAGDGDWTLAGHAFQLAVQADSEYAEAWALLGEANQHTQSSGGIAELTTALHLAPDSTLVQVLTALYWERKGKPELALVYLHQAADAEPSEPTWQIELGNTLAMMGNPEAGLAYIRRAVELDHNDAQSWRMLADYCFSYDVQVRETGLPAARQGLMLAPDNPEGLDLMGWGMIKLGDLVSAERFLQRAVQGDPDSARIHLHLGEYYLAGERYDMAGYELTLALTLTDEDSEIARTARQLIKRNLTVN
jgi:tetratricopeptide (TPR) repeat protein